jgi:hypothetical protein
LYTTVVAPEHAKRVAAELDLERTAATTRST